MSFLVGNGQRVKFWIEKWCGDTPLSHSFPSLFAITSSKEALGVGCLERGGEGHWDPFSVDISMIGRWMRRRDSSCG